MRGEDLKIWRTARGWKQADLMRELDIGSRQTLSTWETSECVPRIVELAVIALDQVEACNHQAGFSQQYSPADIANSWFNRTKIHIIETGAEPPGSFGSDKIKHANRS
jgi:transcriptional regulator with XRE-family HTH domain